MTQDYVAPVFDKEEFNHLLDVLQRTTELCEQVLSLGSAGITTDVAELHDDAKILHENLSAELADED